jgi:hypothetical protein
MKDTNSSHLSFDQLPIEARTLFFIYASAALASYGSHPPTPCGLAAMLETAWNENDLCQRDLSDPSRMTRLLKDHFAALTSTQATRPARARRRMECGQ